MSTYYLMIPNICVQNANCISGPLTYGFPAITAFVGAIHALSRKISEQYKVVLDGVVIGAHDCQLQVFRPTGYSDISFIQRRHPLKKDGSASSIVEEGFAHIEVTLVVEVKGRDDWHEDEKLKFCRSVEEIMMKQRLAGGSVFSIGTELKKINLYHINEQALLLEKLSPAYVLKSSQKALIDHTHLLKQEDPKKTALDALLDLCAIHFQPQENNERGNSKKVAWKVFSKKEGWLVPIPVGFKGISMEFDNNQVSACRAPQYPTHFVETVYSLGEWISFSRIDDLNSMFWRYSTDLKAQLFLVAQS